MARDITEVFRDAVKSIASDLAYDSGKMEKPTSRIISKSEQIHTSFISSALHIMKSIRAAEAFLSKHRKHYCGRHGLSEREKDNVEFEFQEKVNSCRSRIEELQSAVDAHNDLRPTNFTTHVQSQEQSNVHVIAHRHGVVLILSETLHDITQVFDQMRSSRFKQILDRSRIRRRAHTEQMPVGPMAAEELASNSDKGRALLDDETQLLQEELSALLQSSQKVESKMLEISNLSHALSTHVLQQAHQIEKLYNEAVEATSNLSSGNRELQKAAASNNESRVFLLLSFGVLILGVLFLDWYSS